MVEASLKEPVWWIEAIPLTEVRIRFYKLNMMNDDLRSFFFTYTADTMLANVVLCIFYLFASYVPSIIFALLFTSNKPDPYPKSGFTYSQADVLDFQQLLVMVKDLQSKATKGEATND